MSKDIPKLSAEAKNVVKRCLKGDVPGLNGRCPPNRVIQELSAIGLHLQVEKPLHEPKQCYPLFEKEFREKAKELGFE